MTARKRGRPAAGGRTVSPDSILSGALAILDEKGLDGLTMRALASRAGINPMTIYHHFEDRDGLIRSLADRVYADVTAPEGDEPQARLRGLLLAYHDRVVRHPALTLAIFVRPSAFPDQARRITADLTGLLTESGLSPERALRCTHILVDYTHGAALAFAARNGSDRRTEAADSPDSPDSGLDDLLAALLPSPGRNPASRPA